jgi:hypothetical protein
MNEVEGPIAWARKQDLLQRDPCFMAYIDKPAAENGHEPVALHSQDQIEAAVAAERERWELHLSATRNLAEANSKRGDDCGMLARTFLDALKAMGPNVRANRGTTA